MALAIAATRCENPVIIEEADAVSKSYPDFYKDYINLGGVIS
jgi:3-phosphoshikimate 1-carboxyvinyltransferase